MLDAAPPGKSSPPRAANAAAAEMESCSDRDRKNNDEEAVINGLISSIGGICAAGVTDTGPFPSFLSDCEPS